MRYPIFNERRGILETPTKDLAVFLNSDHGKLFEKTLLHFDELLTAIHLMRQSANSGSFKEYDQALACLHKWNVLSQD